MRTSSSPTTVQLVSTALLACSSLMSRTSAYSPPLDRRVMAGLWRLTSPKTPLSVRTVDSGTTTRRPMKEFTVYPKTSNNHKRVSLDSASVTSATSTSATSSMEPMSTKEFLIMLKEDGSFQQYGGGPSDDRAGATTTSSKQKESSSSSWGRSTGWGATGLTENKDDAKEDSGSNGSAFPTTSQTSGSGSASTTSTSSSTSLIGWTELQQGTWDYRDGKLILAADRDGRHIHDTMFVGRVVATSNQSLVQHPVLAEDEKLTTRETNATTGLNATSVKTAPTDTHLSVPKGKVRVGKFFYPKKHPSFFDQPMFKSKRMGSFELRQVLGSLNTQLGEENGEVQDDALLEKFRHRDFYDKRFLLTSHPIENKPKGRMRWSIKYNQYVEEKPPKSQSIDDEQNTPIPIRVMELMLFPNNTFATIKGLGQDAILRGKWDIVGKKRDQFWMQVWRFGFGRSVSGSVYSEGRALSHNDAKSYWGEIYWLEPEDGANEDGEENMSIVAKYSSNTGDDTKNDLDNRRRLQVKGSVIYGSGLEPQPVARFIMTESDATEEEEEEEDDDEDEWDHDELDWGNSFQ